MENTIELTLKNISWNHNLSKVREGDQILVCRLSDFNSDYVPCDYREKNVQIATIKGTINYFGGMYFFKTDLGEMEFRRDWLVSFYKLKR